MTPRDRPTTMSITTSITTRTTILDRFLALPLAHKSSIAITLLCLLSSLVIGLISIMGANKIIEQGTEIYGQSLANQLARGASNPLIQGDHLSLQSLVNDSVSSAALKRVTIYDVNNQPVAEAGEPYVEDSYSASITFQQSIAGYVVVSYDASSLHRQLTILSWQLLALALVLAAIVYGLSLSAGTLVSQVMQNLTAKTQGTVAAAKTPVYPGQDELGELITAVNETCTQASGSSGTKHQTPPFQTTSTQSDNNELFFALATVSLHANNRDESRAYINSDIDSTTLNLIQKQMLTLCKLYDGKFQLISSSELCFQFYQQTSGDSCSFRALCAAYLLRHWINEHFAELKCQIGLDLLATTKASDSVFNRDLYKHRAIDKLLVLNNTHDVAMIATETLCEQSEVSERTNTEWLAADTNKILDINEPYRTLLLGQLKTLDRVGELG